MYVIKESDFLSDYKRLVSYIYAYNKGQKDKNVGFAKVEIRNGQCKININLKGVYTDTPENYGVYFVVRKDGDIVGVKLGDMTVKNGLGEYGDITYPGNINNSGYSFSDIGGIFIGNRNNRHNVLASQWDDEEINTSKIVFPEEIRIKNEKPIEPDKKIELGETASSEKEEAQLVSETQNKNETQLFNKTHNKEDAQASEIQEKNKTQITYVRREEETQEDNDLRLESEATVVDDYNDFLESTKYSEEEGLQDSDFNAQSDWTTIFSQNNTIDAFSDDDYYDCVEITPEDIKKLPLSDTNMYNNSFLMHGYYGYKHILFGKVQKNGEKNLYFIGIPGVYSNREKFMSSMFGFNNFKKSHRSDCRNPYFGYWYMEVYI